MGLGNSQTCKIVLVFALLSISPASWASLGGYSQNFEGLVQSDINALRTDGWVHYGNVWDGEAYTGNYLYGYGPFGAPNGDWNGVSAIASGEGGIEQGNQQLNVYSNYEDLEAHGQGLTLETNVYQEQTVGAENVGQTWMFRFDAKRGNIDGSSTAAAFIKTLDQNNGFALTNFLTTDMTNTSGSWTGYSFSIFIDAGLVGQILQFGFLNTATNYEGSAIFYDNVDFNVVPIPGAALLLVSGLAGLVGFGRKKATVTND